MLERATKGVPVSSWYYVLGVCPMEKDDEKKDAPPKDLSRAEAPDEDDENGDEGQEGPPWPPVPRKPEAPDWLYKSIEDVSKNAAQVYLVFMGFLAYAALTAATTPDRGLILNDKAHLPIVNMDVSDTGFFILAPLLVMLVFVYLQLYIQRQTDLVDSLTLNSYHLEERRLYPWIVNIAAYPSRGIMGELQKLTVTLCIWIAPVIVLNVISLSYIRKHSPFGAYAVGFLTLVGTLMIVFFWKAYGVRIKGKRRRSAWVVISFVVIFELFVLYPVIPWTMSGKRFIGLRVDLSHQKLVNEPSVDYPTMPWQSLKGVRLEGADLEGSVLKRADLSGASLKRAWLEGAILEGAHLEGAHLQEANLWKANLQEAHLEGAILEGANLQAAHLEGASLIGAKLEKANLGAAHLEGAELWGASLEGANLWGADLTKARNLTVDQLAKVKTLYQAALPPDLQKEIQEQYPRLLEKPKPEPKTEEKPK